MGLALVVANVTYTKLVSVPTSTSNRVQLTRRLLRTVARERADDGVLLTAKAVDGALGIALGLGRLVLGLSLSVLLLATRLPVSRAGEVANLEGARQHRFRRRGYGKHTASTA